MVSLISTAPGGLETLPLLLTGEFLYYGIVFFVLAIVAALVGFRGIAGISMTVARLLVLVFIVLAVISVLL